MSSYTIDNSPVTSGVLTTSYSYGTADKEYVFSCKGRPFAALVSPKLPTPAATLLDYDLIRKLGLRMTDVQCRKFNFGGHKMRILGRVSSAVQCVQGGRISGSFHIKGLVVTDLYDLLDTHCVAGTKMRERIRVIQYHSHPTHVAEGSDEDDDNDDMISPGMMTSSSPPSGMMTSSSPPSGMMTSSSPPSGMMTNSPTCSGMMTNSSASSGVMTSSSASSDVMTSSSAPVGMVSSSSATSGTMICSSATSGTSTGSSSVKMSPYVTFPAACNRVAVTKTSYANQVKVPDEPGLFWEDQIRSEDPHYWLNRCLNKNEGESLKQSHIDGLPRVINLGGQNDDMLRVGNWAGLKDPAQHQARHVYLAKIRRYEADLNSTVKVCNFCSYYLDHRCDLFYPAVVHCKECCTQMQSVNRERNRERTERGKEAEKRTKGHANLQDDSSQH